MEEVWRDIKNYEGIYQVSNYGRVKRLSCCFTMRNQVTSWEHVAKEYIFSPSIDSKGYAQVALSIGGTKRTARVHRLVAEAFLEEPSEELINTCKDAKIDTVFVNHIDGCRTNNVVDNLEWCSPLHNSIHTVEIGNHNSVKGEDNYNVILTEEQVLKIYKLARSRTMSQEKIGEIFGVKQITISNINTGRSWAWLTGHKPTKRSRKKRGSVRISESFVK